VTRRFLIHKHPHVITAVEIRLEDSTGVFDPARRFKSFEELVEHFSRLGASVTALEAARLTVDSTGMATLVFPELKS
jgi:hypothetical protein